MAIELAEALVAAHGKGIVHRDLKPDNVMVDDMGRARSSTSGSRGRQSDPSSRPGEPGGDPSISRRRGWSRSLSLGLVLQELFTGESAFARGGSLPGRLERAKRGENLPAKGIDPALADLVQRMKSLAPAARPTALETVDRLRWIKAKPARRRRGHLAVAAFFRRACS